MKIKLFLFLLFSLCNTFSQASSDVLEDPSRKRKLSQIFSLPDVSPLKQEIFIYLPWLKTSDKVEDALTKISPSEQSEILRLTARHFESFFHCPFDEDNIAIHSNYVGCRMGQYGESYNAEVKNFSRTEAWGVALFFVEEIKEGLASALQDGQGIANFITCLSCIDPTLRSTLLTGVPDNFFKQGPFWGAHANYLTRMVEKVLLLREGFVRN